MLSRAAAAMLAGDDAGGVGIPARHAKFERSLMLPWLPDLGQRMIDAGVHEFYDGVGYLLKALPAVPGSATGRDLTDRPPRD
jgi:hypothetical protein